MAAPPVLPDGFVGRSRPTKELQVPDKETSARTARTKAAKKADRDDGAAAVLANIAAMPDADRTLGERLHAIITACAPHLVPRLWYGMPAYAKDGKVVCFFQAASKFKTRYATFGFQHDANLDDGGDQQPLAGDAAVALVEATGAMARELCAPCAA